MVDPRSRAVPPDEKPTAVRETAVPDSAPVDETGPASFPASDPPAVWTWEVEDRLPTRETP
jgi:hypothetical protein